MASHPPTVPQSVPSLSVRRVSPSLNPGNRPSSPCFALFLIERGTGLLRVDYAVHKFAAPALLCLNPYQRAAFSPRSATSGWVLNFHANFFCIETHHHAVGCNGMLFNEFYEVPLVKLQPASLDEFAGLMRAADAELQTSRK